MLKENWPKGGRKQHWFIITNFYAIESDKDVLFEYVKLMMLERDGFHLWLSLVVEKKGIIIHRRLLFYSFQGDNYQLLFI
jgi:hypothetical protein